MKFDNPDSLLDFMNGFRYGWKDKYGNFQMNSLKNFRDNYVTMSIGEIFDKKIGTCIEQSYFQKVMLEKMGFEVLLYVLRSYTVMSDDESTVKMHCFTIYKDGNYWYHFEHANPEMVGIHKYESLDDAISSVIEYFKKRDNGVSRKLDLVSEIPPGYSFSDLLDYVDSKVR